MPTKVTAQSAERISGPPARVDRGQSVFAIRLEGDAVLACRGELDALTIPVLRSSLNRLMRLAPDRVVVDLSEVSFFSAGAIGELVRARNISRAAGGDLVVRAPSPFGRRLLGIVGLTNLIATDSTPANAPAPAVSAESQAERPVELAGRLTAGNLSSVVIDEAKGLIAEHFHLGISEASIMLRSFAAAQQQPMPDVAVALMNRTIDVSRLESQRVRQRAAPHDDTDRGARNDAPLARS